MTTEERRAWPNSKDGNAWNYVTHDHARSRAYRWDEDGLACSVIRISASAICMWKALRNGD